MRRTCHHPGKAFWTNFSENAAQRWRTILGLRSEMYLSFWQESNLTQSELIECLNVIFLQTRVLALHDLSQATKFHDEFFSQLNFQPKNTVNSKSTPISTSLLGLKRQNSFWVIELESP